MIGDVVTAALGLFALAGAGAALLTNGALAGGEVPPRVTGKAFKVRLLTPTIEPSSDC